MGLQINVWYMLIVVEILETVIALFIQNIYSSLLYILMKLLVGYYCKRLRAVNIMKNYISW